MKRIGLAILLLLSFTAQFGYAQSKGKKTIIHVENADKSDFSKTSGRDVQRLIGNVAIRHDSTFFYCDSAYLYDKEKSLDAFSNVHIIVNDSVNIYSDLLYYNGNTKIADFTGNVQLQDDSTVLTTEFLTYDREAHLATYPDKGVTTRGERRLFSKIGHYRDDSKELSFFDSVVMTGPDQHMLTDTLFYNTQIEKMWFLGPTVIVNKENTLTGERGYYWVDNDIIFLDKKPVLYNKTQTAKSDSMYYDREKGFAKIMNNIDMIDTSYKIILRGHYSEIWEKTGKSFVTDSTRLIYYDDEDSLYMRADTLFVDFDTEKEELERIYGYHSVRFYRSDMQGKCDTLIYTMADSTVRMRRRPVLWAEDSQLTADSINILFANNNIDSVIQKNNSFIISIDSIEGYNQIKGKDIASRFKGGAIHKVRVDGNSQTIYWVRDDDTSLIGINITKSDAVLLTMCKNSISEIKQYKTAEETLYPEKDLKVEDRLLSGFKWQSEVRPTDKDDIFRIIPESAESEAASNNEGSQPRRRSRNKSN